jgi:putative ABC transport system permease protein
VLIIGDTVGLKRTQQFTNDTYISSTHWDLSMIVTAGILGLIVLIATVIVIYNIFYISIIEKINQFGLLRAVGSTKRQIRKIVFKEGLILAGVGIPIGIILGHIISFGMGYILSMEELKIRVSIYVVLIAVVISLSTIIISLRKPQKIASKVSPMEAIRYGSMQINSNKKLRDSRKKVSIGNMAFLNFGRNKKRTIMTILSLSMSGILFLTACTFLGSMDIDNLAKTTINYEFALSGNTINKSAIRNIEKINGVKKIITKQCYYGIKVGKTDYALNAFSDDTLNTLKAYIKSGKISSDLLENQNGIIVTVNQDGECKYNIGDKVTLNIKKYNDKLKKEYTIRKEVKVIAIMNDDVEDVVDSMNVQGDAFITSKAAYKKITNDSKIRGVYIRINKNNFDKIKAKIKSISDNNMLYYRSQTDTKNEVLRQLMGIKVALFGLIGIIALIGTLNLINTIITSIVSRKKELGMLQAIGLSNTQMRKMLQMEGLYYSGISILLSITLGIPSGYMAYRLLVSAGADYAIYKFPITPFLIMIVLIISIQLAITFLVGKSIKNESIIDRIRFND